MNKNKVYKVAKRKINAAMILAVDDIKPKNNQEKVSHTKIDGEQFLEIDIDMIRNNPMQPRMRIDEDELNDLMRSIKLHGLIQPIALIRTGKDEYTLKAGQRRWLAHKELGLKKIKAIVQEETILSNKETDKALFEIGVLENIQRDDLNPLELALSLRKALDKKLYKNNVELAITLGKSESHISKLLKVLKLEDEIISDLERNNSTSDLESLYQIQKIKDPTKQVLTYFDFISKRIDRRELRNISKDENLSHTKDFSLYKIKQNAAGTGAKIDLDFSNMDNESKSNILKELEEILKKYT
jgi:ParB family chromosome partitioning protein